MERPQTPGRAVTADHRVKAAIAVTELLAAALARSPTDLVSVELRRAHQIVTRLLRELGVSDDLPTC